MSLATSTCHLLIPKRDVIRYTKYSPYIYALETMGLISSNDVVDVETVVFVKYKEVGILDTECIYILDMTLKNKQRLFLYAALIS
jgi:hypothetical protein